jgi:hypothetical protein
MLILLILFVASNLIAPSTIVTPPFTVPSFLVYQTIAKLFNPYPKFVIVSFAKSIDVPKSFKYNLAFGNKYFSMSDLAVHHFKNEFIFAKL